MKAEVCKLKTDRFTMDYCKFGEGEKAQVMIPGLSIMNLMPSANAIAEAYQVLTKDYTFYVLERRDDLPDHYTVEDTARDSYEAIRELGLNKVTLCGASYGGMVAMSIALSHPELVEKVVVASTSANITDEVYKVVGSWMDIADKGSTEDLCMAFGEGLYPKNVFEDAKPLLKVMATGVSEEDLRRFTVLGRGMKGFSCISRLKEMKCPFFVVGDEQDGVLGAASCREIEEVMKDHPGFEIYMYDGYGHAAFDLAPDFKERILAFLRK